MNLEELKAKMREANKNYEPDAHLVIDQLLLEYINDAEVRALYYQLTKWYE